MAMDFTPFKFKWTFRDYQQKVLDQAKNYLSDRRMHIVAAPGSGKTILGLELIRRLGAPALVLSPSVTIRQQWGDRFDEAFSEDPEQARQALSYTLKAPALITPVTYQALHAAYNKCVSGEEVDTDDEQAGSAEQEDYTKFDLLKTIKKAGIKTICLDEAHHLKSEWQRALEGFIGALKGDVTIIALTATPPYDSSAAEWNRYISLCGDIDAEIFIPLLVKQKTLCPHQDYVWFSYPTREESETLAQFRARAMACVQELIAGTAFAAALDVLQNFEAMEEPIFESPEAFAAICALAAEAGRPVPKKLAKMLSPPAFSLETAQAGLGFVAASPAIFGEKPAGEIKSVLQKNGFMNGAQACLTGDKKIQKMLASSMGKLSGIDSIAKAECDNLGDKLRMLILTDFIKKEALPLVGTDAALNVMGTVPIFESVRRAVGERASIALLAGTQVLVPNEIVGSVQGDFRAKPLPNAPYSELLFSGSNKNKVAALTQAFEGGLINILIGTKSLLGEGWDSPGINSLILASFVGSFMLSNQMRGRAIRTDKRIPDKTANIWHLVTAEPSDDKHKIVSGDYDTLQRRFLGFLAPSYSGGTIESGIARLDTIRPPFGEEGYARINAETLDRAAARADMAGSWDAVLGKFARPEVSDSCEVPQKARPARHLLVNILAVIFWAVAAGLVLAGLLAVPFISENKILSIFAIILAVVLGIVLLVNFKKLTNFISPKNTVRTLAGCLLKAMKKLGLVESQKARLSMRTAAGGTAQCVLVNASAHDNEVFGKAMGELLSAIENPRYVLVKKYKLLSGLSYTNSYACPAAIGANKESAQVLAKCLKGQAGGFEMIYTRSEQGRRHLTKCRQRSYLNRNQIFMKRRKMVG